MNAIIIGGDQTGSYVAGLLLSENCSVRLIEHSPERLEQLQAKFSADVLVTGGYTDPDAMKRAGIETADVLAIVTGLDDVNLVAATIAKFEFGVPRVIALVNFPQNEWLFSREMGVDLYVNQAHLLARVMADEIDLPSMVTLMKLNHGLNSIAQFAVKEGAPADGKAVKMLSVPEDSVLIAIRRGDNTLVTRGETVIRAGDHVLALTTEHSQSAIDALFE